MPEKDRFPQSLFVGLKMAERLVLIDSVLTEFATLVHQAGDELDEDMLRSFLDINRQLGSLREDLAIDDGPQSHLVICKVRSLIRILQTFAGEKTASMTIH